MHYFDIITIAVLGVFGVLGLKKGLVTELFKLVGILLAILMAVNFLDAGIAFLSQHLSAEQNTLTVLSFILIFLVTMVGVRIVAIIVKGIMRFAMMSWVDRTGGALFGALKGAVILSGVLWVVMFLPVDKYTSDIELNSKSYPYLKGFAPKVYNAAFQVIPGSETFLDKVKEYLPDGQSIGTMANFNNQDIMKQLEEQMGGQIDEDFLNKLGDQDLNKMLDQAKEKGGNFNSDVQDKFSKQQQEQLEKLLKQMRSESGEKLPGVP